ncbi:MAG: hypothetical protein ACHREM_14185 [Polyangiales bacterium]
MVDATSPLLQGTLRPARARPAPSAVASIEPASTELVVEVGAVRVRVTPGFDAAQLAEVVRALPGAAR